jgi:Do/DeqQ family serine protease
MNKIMKIKLLSVIILAVFSLNGCAQHSVRDKVVVPTQIHSNYVDLTYAAEKSVHAVVHIKTEFLRKNSTWGSFFDFWEDFFGSGGHRSSYTPILAAGSGVIIEADGYIITNNHVVQDAHRITVTLNDKREYEATIVGTDRSSDLALIKIDATDLPFLSFANSDEVKVGEWVLAVGNPFNLSSTVTAGIVSAKAVDINTNNSSINAYIQTDAAVNQGNSGGALVNTAGNLVGINAAIASGNGYFIGYSFAIPSNIAKKVAEDLKKYGRVNQVYFGVAVVEVDFQMAQELKLNEVRGLYIKRLANDGAAAQAGLKVGDVLLSIAGKTVSSASELLNIMSNYSPGDSTNIRYIRNQKEYTTRIVF